jgi:hypothetical protein
MWFRYHLVPQGRMLPSLGGRTVRPRQLVTVTLVGPGTARARTALLDTGADDTVFPESLAVLVGIDLTNADTGTAAVPGGGRVSGRYASVTLRLKLDCETNLWN